MGISGENPCEVGPACNLEKYNSWAIQEMRMHHQAPECVNNLKKELGIHQTKLLSEHALLKKCHMICKLKGPNGASSLSDDDHQILQDISKQRQTIILSSTMANDKIAQNAKNYIQMVERHFVNGTHGEPDMSTQNLDSVVNDVAIQDPALGRPELDGSVIPNSSQDASQSVGDWVVAVPREEDVPLPAGNLQVAQSFGPKSVAQMSLAHPEVPEYTRCLPFARQTRQVPLVPCQLARLQSSQSQQTVQPPLSPTPGQPSQDSSAMLPHDACHSYASADSKFFCSGLTTAARLDPMQFPSNITEPVGATSAMPPSLHMWRKESSSTTQAAQLEPAPEFVSNWGDAYTL